MSFNISFPNFLCLLLSGILVVHLLTKDSYIDDLPKTPENVEVIFCKLPECYINNDDHKCVSIRRLFLLLGNGCSFSERGQRPEKIVEQLQPMNDSKEVEISRNLVQDEIKEDENIEDEIEEVVKIEMREEKEEDENKEEEEKEKTTSLVDSFVITLLVCSAIVSLMELYREKTKNSEKTSGAGPNNSGKGDVLVNNRRMSLADLTVNRHIRRRDSQQQSDSMRQTTSGSKPPPLIRRSSFPAQLPESRPRHSFTRQQSHPGVMSCPSVRRMSMDLSEDDSSPDRRRVRIIRRH